MAKFRTFDLVECCPNLDIDCDDITPIIDLRVFPPDDINNNNGRVVVSFAGLFTNYTLEWEDGTRQPANIQVVRNNLVPGFYVLTVVANKPRTCNSPVRTCRWVYRLTMPNFSELCAQLMYFNNANDLVPTIPINRFPNGDPNIGCSLVHYWNQNRIMPRGQNGNIQCYQVFITGGVPPYTYIWQDYTSYGLLPAYMTDPPTVGAFPPPILNTAANQTPPKLQGANGQNTICVFVQPNNGNGWIRLTVNDSNQPNPNSITLWLYVMQLPT